MMRKIIFFSFLLSTLGVMAAETITYRLQQVTSVKSGERYVFVQGGRAMDAVVTNGALQTTDQYLNNGLTGNESYVWNLKKVLQETEPLKYNIKSGDSKLRCFSSGTNLTLSSTSGTISEWYIIFDENIATICTDPTLGKCLGYISSTDYQYKAYENRPAQHPHNVAVYQLIPEDYARDIAFEKVGTLGTICLPYQVSAPDGADFYQVAYKTVDTQNNPIELYYEQVLGPLQAGHPYLFVSTNTQLRLLEDKDAPQVSEPMAVNGFYGTFKDIQDKVYEDNSNVLVNNYIIYNNQIQLCGLNCGISPYRAYIKMSEVPLQSSVAAPTRQLVALSQNGQPQFFNPSQNPPTDLSSIMEAGAIPAKIFRNGQVLIQRQGQLYNLFGTRQ